jgi:polyribonucleotide nucleotidyltransferase
VLAAALEQAKEARLAILEVMRGAIAEPRDDVGATAPKIISFEIPLDKIGEVIGPKGKVINAIQSETGADISVDDDGMVGTVAIASTDRGAVAEAERQIRLILNPPTAEVGATYKGRVVNITKFGAFVNILPGRDGLVHISKLGGGKRIERVEDVVDLGDEIEVRVEDVDPNGKISLTPVGALEAKEGAGGDGAGGDGRETVSFEDRFDEELRAELGDLGPDSGRPRDDAGRARSGGGGRDRDRGRGGRGGGGGRGGRR